MTPPSDDEFRAYFDAARKGNARIVGLFIRQHPASIDARPWFTDTTALKEAASYGQKNIIELLLNAGADINKCDDVNKTTPLMSAVIADRDCAILLLDRSADMEKKNSIAQTALMIAASLGKDEMVKLLLDRGADVHVGNDSGYTPLRVAAYYGKAKAAELLLERGAAEEINQYDRLNMTPLMWAANGGFPDMARLLLEFGADASLRNLDGETAADVARRKGNENVACLIEKGVPKRPPPAPATPANDDAERAAALEVLKKRATVRLKPGAKP